MPIRSLAACLLLLLPNCRARAEPAASEPEDYQSTVDTIADRRAALAKRFADGDKNKRAAVRKEARRYLVDAIVDDVFPAWLGTPWGLGRNSTARRPHEPGMTVGCSYFVTSVLETAGLVLDDRYRFAQAPALDIQKSLAPSQVKRFLSIPPAELAERIAALGDGLYLIGLNNHVGFVVVRDGAVRFVHASYTGAKVVTDEPLADAKAIANSQSKGYFVSPLFADDRLVDHWLTGDAVVYGAD